jgi:hypothetical protein
MWQCNATLVMGLSLVRLVVWRINTGWRARLYGTGVLRHSTMELSTYDWLVHVLLQLPLPLSALPAPISSAPASMGGMLDAHHVHRAGTAASAAAAPVLLSKLPVRTVLRLRWPSNTVAALLCHARCCQEPLLHYD